MSNSCVISCHLVPSLVPCLVPCLVPSIVFLCVPNVYEVCMSRRGMRFDSKRYDIQFERYEVGFEEV